MFFHESGGALAITIMMMENLRQTQQPQQRQGTMGYAFFNKTKRTISESIKNSFQQSSEKVLIMAFNYGHKTIKYHRSCSRKLNILFHTHENVCIRH